MLGLVFSYQNTPSLGKIYFQLEKETEVNKGQFVSISHPEGKIIAMVVEISRFNPYFEQTASGVEISDVLPTDDWHSTIVETKPLGLLKNNRFVRLNFPPYAGSKVEIPNKEDLHKFLGFNNKGLHLGQIQNTDAKVNIDVSRLLQKHLAILAMSGAGKCIVGDSKIILSDGRCMKISEMTNNSFNNNIILEGKTEVSINKNSDLAVFSIDKNNKLVKSKIKAFMRRSAPIKLFKIKTRTGLELELTPEHPIPIIENGIKWQEAKSVFEGDYLISVMPKIQGKKQYLDLVDIFKNSDYAYVKDKDVLIFLKKHIQKRSTLKNFAKLCKIKPTIFNNKLNCQGFSFIELNTILKELGINKSKIRSKIKYVYSSMYKIDSKILIDDNFARLLGYLLAEGHNTGTCIIFTNNDLNIQKDFVYLFEKVFGIKPIRTKYNEFRKGNRLIAEMYNNIGFTNSSWTKFIIEEINLSKDSVLNNFLSAFIDCDGFISKDNSEIEITLASTNLIEGINKIFSRMQIKTVRKNKKYKGKVYSRLFVRGVSYFKKLDNRLNLLISYKRENLCKYHNLVENSNIRVIPNMRDLILEIANELNVPSSSLNLGNFFIGKHHISRNKLMKLLNKFESNKSKSLKYIKYINDYYKKLPKVDDKYAKNIISKYYPKYTYVDMVKNIDISPTTARRVSLEIIEPNISTFNIAKNILDNQNIQDDVINTISNIDLKDLISGVEKYTKFLGLEINELTRRCNLNKQYFYSYKIFDHKYTKYSNILKIYEILNTYALSKRESIGNIDSKLNLLKSFINDELFFDQIVEINEIKSKEKYVYDLNVENSNFVANDILIHNSYSVSVLLEELLNQPKDSSLGIVLFDVHGEYKNFAEPVSSSEHKDFSKKVRYFDAAKMKLALHSLDENLFFKIMGNVSSAAYRELSPLIRELKSEMKDGTVFDFAHIKQKVENKITKANVRDPILGSLSQFEHLGLFSKTSSFNLRDIVKPGQLTIIDLADVLDMTHKQILLAYFASNLFRMRQNNKIGPFSLILEEAHQFVPEGKSEDYMKARAIIETIAREGRKFGASLCLVSQRPIKLSTTVLSQCNTHMLLRITNPYDLKHIAESSEGLDSKSTEIITGLDVGEALMVGSAVNHPLFFKVRERTSQPNKYEFNLQDMSKQFTDKEKKKDAELDSFL